jgi:hypothetical protein
MIVLASGRTPRLRSAPVPGPVRCRRGRRQSTIECLPSLCLKSQVPAPVDGRTDATPPAQAGRTTQRATAPTSKPNCRATRHCRHRGALWCGTRPSSVTRRRVDGLSGPNLRPDGWFHSNQPRSSASRFGMMTRGRLPDKAGLAHASPPSWAQSAETQPMSLRSGASSGARDGG